MDPPGVELPHASHTDAQATTDAAVNEKDVNKRDDDTGTSRSWERPSAGGRFSYRATVVLSPFVSS
jgi:hypothetical protein